MIFETKQIVLKDGRTCTLQFRGKNRCGRYAGISESRIGRNTISWPDMRDEVTYSVEGRGGHSGEQEK